MINVNRSKGFTLVELIVVIAIVAILASISAVGYSQFVSSAKNSTANNELNQVYNVIYSDAARPGEIKEYAVTTDGSKLKFLFSGFTKEEIKDQLVGLLGVYLNEGFYQGEFLFTKNLMSYNSPGGGYAEREIDFDFGLRVSITVKNDGSLDTVVDDLTWLGVLWIVKVLL